MPPLLPFNMANPLVRSAVQVETSRIKEAIREAFKDNMAELKSARDTDERKMEGLKVQNRQRRQRIRGLVEDLKQCRNDGRTSQAEIQNRRQMLTDALGQLRACNEDTARLTRERDEARDADDIKYAESTHMRMLAQSVQENNRPRFDAELPRLTSEPTQAYKEKMQLIFDAMDEFRRDHGNDERTMGEMDDQIEDLRHEVQREKTSLEQLQARYDRDMAAARQDLATRTSRLEKSRQLHEASTADLSKMRAMATAVKEGKEQLVNSIRAGIQSAPGQAHAQTMREIFDALQRCIKLEANRAGTDSAIADLRQQVEAAKKALAEEKESCATEIRQRQEKVEERDRNIDVLRTSVQQAETDKATMETELAAAKETATLFQQQSTLLQESISAKDIQLAEMESTLVSAKSEAATCQESLTKCRKEIITNAAALAAAEEKSKTMSGDAEKNLKGKIENLRELNAKFEGIQIELQEKLETWEKTAKDCAQQVLEQAKTISGLMAKVSEKISELKICKAKVERFEQAAEAKKTPPNISRGSLRSAGQTTTTGSEAGTEEAKGISRGGAGTATGTPTPAASPSQSQGQGGGAGSSGQGADKKKGSGGGSAGATADQVQVSDDELKQYTALLAFEIEQGLRVYGKLHKDDLHVTTYGRLKNLYLDKVEPREIDSRKIQLLSEMLVKGAQSPNTLKLKENMIQGHDSIPLRDTNAFKKFTVLRKRIGKNENFRALLKKKDSRIEDQEQRVRLFFLVVFFNGLYYTPAEGGPPLEIFARKGSLPAATAAFNLRSLFVWL